MATKKKIFRISRMLAGEFEKVCTILGIRQRDAAGQAIKAWLEKNRSQASIEAFMKAESQPIIFQNITLIKTQLNIVKAEFRRTLENLERAPEEHKVDFMKELREILPTAMTLAQETRDPELQALITRVERWFDALRELRS